MYDNPFSLFLAVSDVSGDTSDEDDEDDDDDDLACVQFGSRYSRKRVTCLPRMLQEKNTTQYSVAFALSTFLMPQYGSTCFLSSSFLWLCTC